MADVIQLHPTDSPIFRELLADTLERLESAANVLLEDAMNLGMRGPWQEWNDRQPVGAVMELEPAALADCGDARIAKLYALCCDMTAIVDELRERKANDGA